MITYSTYKERLNYILRLVERKQTGIPAELASKLNLSKRARIVSIVIFLGAFCLSSCNSSQSYEVYIPNYEIFYEIEIIENDDLVKTDSIIFRVLENGKSTQTAFGQRSIEWYYPSESINKSEITGISEEDNGKKVFLHPPRNHYLKFTELAPFPDINIPLGNSTSKSYTIISHGFGDWNGEKIKKLDTLNKEAKTTIYIDTLALECFIVSGVSNETPIGKISTKFYFNEIYGFIKFQYFIHEENKRITLTATSFKGVKDNSNNRELQ